jgi:hypothetical protein
VLVMLGEALAQRPLQAPDGTNKQHAAQHNETIRPGSGPDLI